MRPFLVPLLVLAAAAVVPAPSSAAPCYPDMPCCQFGEVAIGWRCVGPCDVVGCRASVDPWPYCFSKVDDMIHDGGSTWCVDPNGDCRVSESREYIWGREEYCVVA